MNIAPYTIDELDEAIATMTDKDAIEIAMMKRALDPAYPSFTFNAMRRVSGLDAHWRTVDRLLQKWRKAGFASYQRQGRLVVWTLTEAGKLALTTRLKMLE